MPRAAPAPVAEPISVPAPAPVAEPISATAPVGGRGGGSDFAPLLRMVREQGLLERRTAWYARGITVDFVFLAAIITGMVLLGPSWWTLLLAPALAVVSARISFVAHDAGHAQITTDRGRSRVIQLVHANLLLGMSQEWWNSYRQALGHLHDVGEPLRTGA